MNNETSNEPVFEDVYEVWNNKTKGEKFWYPLAERYNTSVEALRSWFKRERKKRQVSLRTNGRSMQESPRVGIFDIEMLPLKIEGYLWGVRDQYIGHEMIQQPYTLLSWAGKHIDNSQIYSDVLTSKEAKERNSYRITKTAMEFLNNCDIVIYHNGNSYDRPAMNTELALHGLPPVKYRSIDTLTLIRQNFRLPSYKLDYVNRYFGIEQKIENDGMPLWIRCAEGDQDALIEMLTYNEGDVVACQDLFFQIQAYCSSLPNFSTYRKDGQQNCNCGGKLVLDKKNPYWFTNASMFERLRCSACGSVHRGKKNLLTKEQHVDLKISL